MTTEIKKSQNSYTEEQTKAILEKWGEFCTANPQWFEGERVAANNFIQQLSTLYGKTTRSIISKLSRSNVGYIAKTYTTKNGSAPAKKDEVAEFIGKVLQLSESDTDSLTKANKSALAKIRDSLASSVPMEVLNPEQLEQRDSIAVAIGQYCLLDNPAIFQRLPLSDLYNIANNLGIKTESESA